MLTGSRAERVALVGALVESAAGLLAASLLGDAAWSVERAAVDALRLLDRVVAELRRLEAL